MKQVAAYLNDPDVQDAHRALIRLWVLANDHDGADLALNAWEKKRAATESAHENMAMEFLHRLERRVAIGQADVEAYPLAVVEALDNFLATTGQSQQRLPRFPIRLGEEAFWLVPTTLARRRNAPFARQAGKHTAWFRHHHIVPAILGERNINIHVTETRRSVDDRLSEILQRGSIRIGVVHFEDGVLTEFQQTNGTRVTASGLADPIAREASLLAALQYVHEEKTIDVIVFPELTVTLALRDSARAWIARNADNAPALVLPGSFHERVDGGTYNRAELVAFDGSVQITHRKLTVYGAAEGLAEDIHIGNRIDLLVTCLGSFVIPICLDFCDVLMRDVWLRLGADWHLVPSMSHRISAHTDTGKAVYTSHAAVSAIANQEPPPAQPGGSPAPAQPGFIFHQSPWRVREFTSSKSPSHNPCPL